MECMYIILHTYMSTPKSHRPKPLPSPKRRGPQTRRACLTPAEPPTAAHPLFGRRQLLRQFHKLLPAALLASWLAGSEQVFYQRAFTPLITLWYLRLPAPQPPPPLSLSWRTPAEGGADRLSPRGRTSSRPNCTPKPPPPSAMPASACPWNCSAKPSGTRPPRRPPPSRAPQCSGFHARLDRRFTCRLRPLAGHSRAVPAASAWQLQKTALLVSGARGRESSAGAPASSWTARWARSKPANRP